MLSLRSIILGSLVMWQLGCGGSTPSSTPPKTPSPNISISSATAPVGSPDLTVIITGSQQFSFTSAPTSSTKRCGLPKEATRHWQQPSSAVRDKSDSALSPLNWLGRGQSARRNLGRAGRCSYRYVKLSPLSGDVKSHPNSIYFLYLASDRCGRQRGCDDDY